MITQENLQFCNPFQQFQDEKEILTPIPSVKRYKNWLRQKDGLEGYCYLKMYKRRYCPYAHLLYGKGPELGKLNLDEKY